MKFDRETIVARLCLAGMLAVLVTAACLQVTWGSAGTYVAYSQTFTQKVLKIEDEEIKTYRSKKGFLPQSLNDVEAELNPFPATQQRGLWRDAWRRPLVYRVRAKKYLLLSYGRDGKPGGVGLDGDLSPLTPRSTEAKL